MREHLQRDQPQLRTRGHRHNLWFVAGARDRDALDAVFADIAAKTGLTPLDLPMEREYHIDLGFSLRDSGARGRAVPQRRQARCSRMPTTGG